MANLTGWLGHLWVFFFPFFCIILFLSFCHCLSNVSSLRFLSIHHICAKVFMILWFSASCQTGLPWIGHDPKVLLDMIQKFLLFGRFVMQSFESDSPPTNGLESGLYSTQIMDNRIANTSPTDVKGWHNSVACAPWSVFYGWVHL